MKKKDLEKEKENIDNLTPEQAEEILVERIADLLVQQVLADEAKRNN